MNARPSPVSLQTAEARIAEARMRGNLRTIYEAGGMKAVVEAARRAVRDIAQEKRDELPEWVV